MRNDTTRSNHHRSSNSVDHLTASMIRDYLRCGKLFYYRYILNIKLPDKPVQLVFGGAVHEAIDAFYKKDRDPLIVFEEEFQKVTKLTFQERSPHLNEGRRLLRYFIENQDYLTQYHEISQKGTSELMFKTNWQDPITGKLFPVPITGRFDRVTDVDQVIEVKTSSKPYKQNEVDTSVQGSVYPFSYLMLNDKMPKEVIYIVLIKGRKNPIQVLKTTRTKEQLSQTFQTAELILKGIKANMFEKGSGFMHKFCQCKDYEEALLI